MRSSRPFQLGYTLDKVFALVRASFFPMLAMMLAIWLSSFVIRLLTFVGDFQHLQQWQATLYIALMFFIVSGSAWMFIVQRQVSLRIYQGWRKVLPSYRQYAFRYFIFYFSLAFFLMFWFALVQGFAHASGLAWIALPGIVVGLSVFIRALVILPLLQEGLPMSETLRHGWRLGQKQMSYLWVHMVTMLLLVLLSMMLLAFMQSICFMLFHLQQWTENQRLLWMQSTAGLSLFFALPFMHAYLVEIWQKLECRWVAYQGVSNGGA